MLVVLVMRYWSLMLCGLFKSCLLRENQLDRRVSLSSSTSSDLAEVSAAQQTAEPVNIVNLTSVVTLAVTARGPESSWSWANDPIIQSPHG